MLVCVAMAVAVGMECVVMNRHILAIVCGLIGSDSGQRPAVIVNSKGGELLSTVPGDRTKHSRVSGVARLAV
jgi:hypothetical protein